MSMSPRLQTLIALSMLGASLLLGGSAFAGCSGVLPQYSCANRQWSVVAEGNGVADAAKANLFDAATAGDVAGVRALLSEHADVNAKQSTGDTALILAARSGESEVVQVLLASQANVNVQDFWGRTALMYASEKGSLPSVQALLGAGADVNVVAKNGDTALTLASDEND